MAAQDTGCAPGDLASPPKTEPVDLDLDFLELLLPWWKLGLILSIGLATVAALVRFL